LPGQQEIVNRLSARLAVAGAGEPADLLLKNARLVNVFSAQVVETNLAVKDGFIAAVGPQYSVAEEIIDLEGQYLSPGLIDAHLHIESTLLMPGELARVITAHGTTCVINDPHEIANVLGVDGVNLMIGAAEGLPCDFMFTVPSCVPATTMETAGGEITAGQIAELLTHPRVVGLGEMMNYPGVIGADPAVLEKLAAAHRAGKVIDGHAPAVGGTDLQAYLSCGVSTDHECLTAREALEKISGGMKVIIRHGSASSSLAEILPLVNENNAGSFMFGSDDREAAELLEKGHLDDLLKTAVALGGDPLLMIKLATINPARHYRLYDRGAIAPGYRADLVVFEDLRSFRASLVIKDGRPVARGGRMISPIAPFQASPEVLHSVRLARAAEEKDFALQAPAGRVHVIGVIPGQLITAKLQLDLKRGSDGLLKADPAAGINKIAVIERHEASGRLAVALVRGFGLREGALASSVAHDSHNIIVVGVEEKAMASAVNEIARLGGGFAAVDGGGEVRASLALPVAGLMSAEPAKVVAENMKELLKAARGLGTEMPQPFLTLSFLALPVIPSLKITDRGLFDVDSFNFI
jgi:adenine deaminase